MHGDGDRAGDVDGRGATAGQGEAAQSQEERIAAVEGQRAVGRSARDDVRHIGSGGVHRDVGVAVGHRHAAAGKRVDDVYVIAVVCNIYGVAHGLGPHRQMQVDDGVTAVYGLQRDGLCAFFRECHTLPNIGQLALSHCQVIVACLCRIHRKMKCDDGIATLC